MIIADHDIGGARVRRVFTRGSRHLRGGDMLSGDEVRAIPVANRRALIDAGYIEVWPKSGEAAGSAGERHIVHRGKGQFDVIAGVKLNAEPMSKEDAEELATRPN